MALLAPAGVQAAPETAKYTVMVYMNGSDLESDSGAATSDLLEMMAVGSDADTNVVVETMGTRQWLIGGVEEERRQRWLVQNGQMPLEAAAAEIAPGLTQAMAALPDQSGLKLLWEGSGSQGVGDPAALTDFIVWTMEHYPAEKYVLIFWNHGGGSVAGFGHDELTGGSLSLAGIQQGIADAHAATGQTLEVVGFDACLMATVEVASLLRPHARYLVASEELEPGHGWNYTPVLQAIDRNPDLSGAELGRVIADGFKAQAEEQGTSSEITLSVTDLSRVDAVVAALEAFVAQAAADVADVDRIRQVAEARRLAESYGQDPDAPTDMVDLGDLARHAASSYPEAAADLLQALEAAVVYNVTSAAKPDATGLSVYMPYANRSQFLELLQQYQEQTPFSEEYKTFAQAFADNLFSPERKEARPLAFASPEVEVELAEDATYYTAWISPESIPNVAEISWVLAEQDPEDPNVTIFLASDTNVDFDPETGQVVGTWNDQVVTMNGHFVSMFLANESETASEYMIPVLLNGEPVNIMAVWTYETENMEIIGAWPGIDADSGMAAREITPIQPGDTITPLFDTINEETGEEGLYQGEPFTVADGLQLGMTAVPMGTYLYGFEIYDHAGNVAFTDWAAVEFMEVPEESAEEGSGGAEEAEDAEANRNQADQPAEWPAPTAPPGRTIRLWIDQTEAEVNGERQLLDVAPQIVAGSTMVPLRFLGEALGAGVTWNPADSSVTYTLGNNQIVVWVGATRALVNDAETELTVAPAVIGGRTLVPLRFVSESLGAAVQWLEAEQGIVITFD